LDRHHHLDAYIQAKQRIYDQAKTVIYNRDDVQTFPNKKQASQCSEWISFGLDTPDEGAWGLRTSEYQTFLVYGQEHLLTVDSLKIKGRHNWQNALAACALIKVIGVKFCHMVSVLQRFPGLQHRSQWIRTIDGVDWINDSKGTNIGATLSAIMGIGASMPGKIVLIAGGQGKGADFTLLRATIAAHVRSMVLIGEDASILDRALADLVNVDHASSLAEAVSKAKRQAQKGDVVLLSPACASLDMFRDFNHRGDVFVAAVEAL
jgi:UDP-N-acetylmuramoylalanine--D-glutamate ligase